VNLTLHRVDAGFNTIAVLEYEARRARDVALVVAHGYSSSKHNLDSLCAFLASHGFTVYSLDFPGHKLGASGGTLRSAHDLFDAMEAVIRFARNRGAHTIYALGHSMGATTALCVTARDPALAGVIAIATGYGRPTALDALAARGVVDLRSSYVDGLPLQEIAREWEPHLQSLLSALANRPALIIAATRDGMVSQASVQDLYNRIPGETKTFATIESDHTFAGENSRTTILQWLNTLHPRTSAQTTTNAPSP
jgi:esterase/lipase